MGALPIILASLSHVKVGVDSMGDRECLYFSGGQGMGRGAGTWAGARRGEALHPVPACSESRGREE